MTQPKSKENALKLADVMISIYNFLNGADLFHRIALVSKTHRANLVKAKKGLEQVKVVTIKYCPNGHLMEIPF